MALEYNIVDVIDITDANADVNAIINDVNNDAYEMGFVGVANFLSGNYAQPTSDINDITSNLTVSQSALNNAHFFYVSNVDTANSKTYPGGGESAYGANITQTGTLFGTAAVTKVAMANNDPVEITNFATFGNEFIAMTNITNGTAETVVNSTDTKLLKDQSSVGDGLLQAVSAALFKKLGKNAALLNDTDLVSSLNTKFYNALNGIMGEANTDYANSGIFQRYLGQGKYESEAADADGNDIDYQLNGTLVNMVINLSGQVVDTDNGPNLASNTAAINSIFGVSGTDHKVSVTTGSIGQYSIKLYVSLKHDDRF